MSPGAIVRADGVFEAALGVVLVAGAAAGRLDGGDFPEPVGTTVIVVVGVALIVLGVVLSWLAGGDVPPQLLRNLALGNSVTAVAAIVWRLAAEGFSDAGSAIVLTTAGALLVLAALQVSAATLRAGRALRR
jgi:asparagine N-glycosylation enzyme membrane subunit Stt3